MVVLVLLWIFGRQGLSIFCRGVSVSSSFRVKQCVIFFCFWFCFRPCETNVSSIWLNIFRPPRIVVYIVASTHIPPKKRRYTVFCCCMCVWLLFQYSLLRQHAHFFTLQYLFCFVFVCGGMLVGVKKTCGVSRSSRLCT